MDPQVFMDFVMKFQYYILSRGMGNIPDDLTFLDYINARLEEDKQITPAQFEQIMNAEEHRDAVIRLRMIREHYYLRRMEDDPKKAVGNIFALKQLKNGGYTDRRKEDQTERTLTVNLEGVGGEEAYL